MDYWTTRHTLILEDKGSRIFLEITRRTLCPPCNAILDAVRQYVKTKLGGFDKVATGQEPNFKELQKLTEDGRVTCPMCATIYRINERRQNGLYASDPALKFYRMRRTSSHTVLDLVPSATLSNWDIDAFQIHVLPLLKMDENVESLLMSDSYSYPRSTGDDAIVGLIQGWMDKCSGNHQCYNASATYYPPRLLDLTGDCVHLRTAEELRASNKHGGSYATLSHCWGGVKDFGQLSSANMEEFRSEGIPLDNFPKTFQHAIVLCRKLEIYLLWIDSLCILQSGQGSGEDWLHHLTEMRMIYYRCTINIAADHSANPHGGLFVDRAPDPIKPAAIMHLNKPHLIAHPELDSHVYGDSLLSQRGWVFQERLLSPRVIHFSHDQVYWECAESCQVSETYPAGITKLDGPVTGCPRAFHLPSLEKQQAWTPDLTEAFCQFVEEFSRRALTYPHTDKLPAFAGVAEHFSRIVEGTRYVAGLFRDHLPEALLWVPAIRPPPEDPLKSNPHEYRCPSWSWAKLYSKAEMFRHQSGPCGISGLPHSKSLLQIKDISVDLDDPKYEFGCAKSAILTMSARLMDIRWKEKHPHYMPELQWREWWNDIIYLQPGRSDPVTYWRYAGDGLFAPWDPADMLVTAVCFDSVQDSCVEPENARFMPITRVDIPRSSAYLASFRDLVGVAGLILKKIETDGSDCYRRIGSAKLVGEGVEEYILRLPEQHVILK